MAAGDVPKPSAATPAEPPDCEDHRPNPGIDTRIYDREGVCRMWGLGTKDMGGRG